MLGSRGLVGDKWSSRILWFCALGSAVGFYMVALERRAQNMERAMAEYSKELESGGQQSSGGDV
ncbi:uncharacterized protein LOC116255793 [Nymphaea colorata]|nr:uncharacterized protein LOC116255793 [Nymphaea colorata]